MSPDLFLKLAVLSLSKEQMEGVVDVLKCMEAEHAAAVESGREKVRNRVRKWRENHPVTARNVTERSVTTHASASPAPDLENKQTNKQENKKERYTALSRPEPERDWFSEFWLAYPRRDGDNPKKPARLIFQRLLAKGVSPERLIAEARALALKHPTPTPYVPQAKTWLGQERFADAEPVIPGDTFCPEDDPTTRWHVIRFHNEHDGADPPKADHGGRAGYLIPAAWVKAMQMRQQAANG